MDLKEIEQLSKDLGDSFYLLDLTQFRENYHRFLESFRSYYDNTMISYSYKTNYLPILGKTIEELGGYAEVVSDMEYEIAEKAGVPAEHIILNGPYKDYASMEKLLLNGGKVNIDSVTDLSIAKEIAHGHPEQLIKIGIRCNFDIGDHVLSRFGFDAENSSFYQMIDDIQQSENLRVAGIHMHFATRDIRYWPERVRGALKIFDHYWSELEYLSLGGGIFGNMDDSLKRQFGSQLPSYQDYAQIVGPAIRDYFSKKNIRPMVFLEPGTALSGDIMRFYAKVVSIKNMRGKAIATLSGSIYNINPTLNKKNPPIHVYSLSDIKGAFENLDFGGFTCIESDYLYHGYSGPLGVGDIIEFSNVGSYSIVLKPPFILPNVPVMDYDFEHKEGRIIKRQETFEDLFTTFIF